MIKDLVRQRVGQSLTNHTHVLSLALLSVIDSCRLDPIKFNVLYHNLSLDAITKETGLAEFDMIDQFNHGYSTNDPLCYQHDNANDNAYWKVLLDTAEQFFDRIIKELKHVSIRRIIEAHISGSISSQLAKKSILDSDVVVPIHAYENEKEDPIQ